ncbi:MAG: hypothetical protein JNL58_11685 [Planctomyces sp.]|nr:hypothetical protein [Planctomyces sp.]
MARTYIQLMTLLITLASGFGVDDTGRKSLLFAGEPIVGGQPASAVDESVTLSLPVDQTRTTRIQYSLSIRGKMITSVNAGPNEMDLSADAKFDFLQRQFTSKISGPYGLRAVRRFDTAEVVTTVAKNHKTSVVLPNDHRLCSVWGTDFAVVHLSPDVRLTRQQVDLLQLPCDPIVVGGLMPSRTLASSTEKWNTDSWVIPLLSGLEAAVTQSATCEIQRITSDEAVVVFTAKADGAIAGSGSAIGLEGQLTVDRKAGYVKSLKAVLTEKRSPGTVSPGLDVKATIEWTQTLADKEADLPKEPTGDVPDERQLLLTLPTPWRLMMLHSRDWYVFHESADVIMLRLLDHGSLIGQLNVAVAPSMPAGQATPEEKFRDEVKQSLVQQKGETVSYQVIPSKDDWKVQHVHARSMGTNKAILWDYYLCTWKTGEQFLLIFSHAEENREKFAGAAGKIIESLTIRPVRPGIVLPR